MKRKAKRAEQRVPEPPRAKRGKEKRLLLAAAGVAEVVGAPTPAHPAHKASAVDQLLKMREQFAQLNRKGRQELTLGWVAETGVTPLEFLITEMRNVKNNKKFRAHCAVEAMPFVHRKMPSMVELERMPEGDVLDKLLGAMSDAELQQMIDLMERAAPRVIEGTAKREDK